MADVQEVPTPRQVAHERLVAAFNEWMQRYLNNPEQFEREWQTVNRQLEETRRGLPLTYGETCAAYLETLLDGIPVAQAPAPPNASK